MADESAFERATERAQRLCTSRDAERAAAVAASRALAERRVVVNAELVVESARLDMLREELGDPPGREPRE